MADGRQARHSGAQLMVHTHRMWRYFRRTVVPVLPAWAVLGLALGFLGNGLGAWLAGAIIMVLGGIGSTLTMAWWRFARTKRWFPAARFVPLLLGPATANALILTCLYSLRLWEASPATLHGTLLWAFILFLTTTALLLLPTLLEIRRLRNQRIVRSAYAAQQKVFTPNSDFDPLRVIEFMNRILPVLSLDPARAKNLLMLAAERWAVLSDIRYHRQVPLRQAVPLITRAVEIQRKQYGRAATCRYALTCEAPGALVQPSLVAETAAAILGYCIATYGTAHLELRAYCVNGKLLVFEFTTSIPCHEQWFNVSEEMEDVREALERIVMLTNASLEHGVRADRVSDDQNKYQVWRIEIPQAATEVKPWEDIEMEIGRSMHGGDHEKPMVLVSTCEQSGGSNRVYRLGETAVKVMRLHDGNCKDMCLEEEFLLLSRLRGVAGVPRAMEYTSAQLYEWMSYAYIDGVQLGEWLARDGNGRWWFRVLADLTEIARQLWLRGVAHRDWRPENIVISSNGAVNVIDFDQAITVPLLRRSLDIGGRGNSHGAPMSVDRCIDRLGLAEQCRGAAKLLQRAWQIAQRSRASSPGAAVAYYAFSLGTHVFPGERQWYERWIPIRHALGDLSGKRILECGCNMGMLSSFCNMHGAETVGVEMHDDILEAARLFAQACGSSASFRQGDLASERVFSELGSEYDLVVALSVVHWLRDPRPFMEFLRGQRAVLYEGHGSLSESKHWLERCGFPRQEVLCYTERLRPLILASHG